MPAWELQTSTMNMVSRYDFNIINENLGTAVPEQTV